MSSTETASYTRTAKILHWLIALAIIFMLALGWSFDLLHSYYVANGETKFALIQLHKSIGITILALSVFRLVWRLLHRAPPLPSTMPRWEQNAAHIGHFLLYVAMVGMPLSGWVMVSSSGHNIPTILYGLIHLPNLPVAAEDKETVNSLAFGAHSLGAYVMAVLVVGHVAAALKHHFISQDDILIRMAPKSCAKFLSCLRGAK